MHANFEGGAGEGAGFSASIPPMRGAALKAAAASLAGLLFGLIRPSFQA
jgi:hypothetical protein